MPEPEGRSPAFYDHEIDEPRATGRRRRQVADWGVGEDVFDRLPSRRFDRRGEEHRSAARHEDFTDPEWAADDYAARGGEPAWVAEDGADRRRRFERREDFAGRDDAADSRRRFEAREDFAGPDEPAARDEAERAVADWFEEPERLAAADVVSDGQRTIVVGGALEEEIPPPAPRERRTIVIGGDPDGLPVVRQRRPPRTGVERVGTSPDRIVAYAVALGFLLILIAILTTGH